MYIFIKTSLMKIYIKNDLFISLLKLQAKNYKLNHHKKVFLDNKFFLFCDKISPKRQQHFF